MIYFFDGTKNGFLTAFLQGYSDPDALLTSKDGQLYLGQTPVFIHTQTERAQKAEERLLCFDPDCMRDLDILLRCGEKDSEQVAFRYLRLLTKHKRPIGGMLAETDVFRAVNYMKKVRFEIHRFHGFIRFMQTESGALYAPFSPDNDICDLLAPHFKSRLPQFPFVLHDVSRKKATVYDGKNVFNAYLPTADVVISADETEWQALWKEYYRAVNIPCRERLKQMRGYLPARYWKFLPEKE